MTGLPAPTFRTILLTFRTASSKALMERRWDLIHRGIRRIMRLIMEEPRLCIRITPFP